MICVFRQSRGVCLLVACGFAMALAGCNPFADPKDKARAAFEQGDLATARIEAATAIQKSENDAEAHLLLGSILLAQGDLVTAERTLKRSLDLGIDRTRVDPLLARVWLRTGQHQVILDELKATPSHQGAALAVVLAARGQALLAQRDIEGAQAALDEALKVVADLPEALIGQAQLAYMREDTARAMSLVEQVLAKQPRQAEAWEMKAQMLVLAGKAEEAIAAYDEAAKANPANLTLDLSAAELLLEAKRFGEARKRIDAVRARAPDYAPGRYLEAQWHFIQRDYDKALEVAQDARRHAPGFAPLGQLIAMTHLARGNPNQAEEELRALVQTHPRHLGVRRLYATTLIRQGKAKAALDVIGPVLEKLPDDPTWLRLAADAYAATRDYSRATQALERAAKATPGDATAQARLGLLRLAGGDTTRGLRALEDAVAADPQSIGPDVALALLHLERRDFAKAVEIARGIQVKQPKQPIGFHLAALAQAGTQRMPEARQSFQRALELDPGYWPAVKALARIEEVAGRPDQARTLIEALLARDPANVEAQYALFHFTGDRGKLIAALETARRADPKILAPRLMLAHELGGSGLSNDALAVAREAAAIAPDDPAVLLTLGTAQLAADRKSEALETFRRVASEQPRSAIAQLRLAQTLAVLGDVTGAEATFKKALALRPHDPEATEALAKLYARTQREAAAMQLAQALKKQWPKSGAGYALAGDLLLAQKKAAEALKAYDEAFARAPSGALVVQRHRVSVAMGMDPGLAPLEAWLAKHPRDAQVRLYVGNRHYAAGQYDIAAKAFRSIVEVDPKHGYALNNLASAYLKLKDARALPTAQSAYALLPDDADVLDTLGVALTRAGQAEQGAQMLKKALGRNPNSVDTAVRYALALARSGDREAGREVLARLAAKGIRPELDADVRDALGIR
jgi:putative PEP-CTERM system TPR-repeat lipoprotein